MNPHRSTQPQPQFQLPRSGSNVSSYSVQTNNHNANANANPAQPQPVVKRRMQMFGSEYAKFLSNTAFGPRLVTPESSTRSTTTTVPPCKKTSMAREDRATVWNVGVPEACPSSILLSLNNPFYQA
mmetsp:Transcript_55095/g.64447  ORF Transcript_55095/g.64447 Transcript_55095/m.64447 type:complete len:126 (-) Transcript_55095:346-723(-)